MWAKLELIQRVALIGFRTTRLLVFAKPPSTDPSAVVLQSWQKINGQTAKFKSQSRETASKRKLYRGLGTR